MKKLLIYTANRLWLILLLYITSLLSGAFCFSLLEAKSFADGLWWATVTSLTIGYGDLTPVTTAGRIIGILFGHFWIFVVIPMIVANIIMHLVEDKHLFSDDEQRELMDKIRRIESSLSQQQQKSDH
ncbi:potassium channel family protein [Rheinheimera sp.]|uniref:potassium channel family protein n=1 Tax=Rheinheimera sp. TaxID=1869214 RepID=UPI002FDD3C4E